MVSKSRVLERFAAALLKLMKTKFKSTIDAVCQSFGGAICAGAVLLIASGARAQNLFVSDFSSVTVTEFTPGGVAKHLCLRVV